MTDTPSTASLAQQVETDIVEALKARESVRLGTLRLLKAAAKNVEVEKHRPLSDDEYVDVIMRQAKMRRDAAGEYEKAGRPDRAEAELQELAVLEPYLPAQFGEDELRATVLQIVEQTGATGPRDMGRVMPAVLKVLKGRADGAAINAVVRDVLSSQSG